jgi:AraC-like DNA-binding protein
MRIRITATIILASLAVIWGLILLIPREEVILWPQLSSEVILPEADRQSIAQGESELISFTADSSLTWITRLVKLEGIVEWPYAGIKIELDKALDGKCADWSRMDTLYLRLSSSLAHGFALGLDTRVPKDSDFPDAGKMRRLQMAVPSNREIRSYAIALGDLQVPQWWKEQYRLSLLDNRGFLESVCAINLINTSDLQRTNEIDTTILLSASLKGLTNSNPNGVFFILLGMALLLLPIWKPQQFGLVPPSPAPIGLKDHEKELYDRVAEWYNLHYMENDLTISRAAKSIGVHSKKLQLILRAAFQTTHKARLNELRLLEASRLLRESDNPVGEIALSVGYNTVSHFNRSFKERFGHSPLEHRNSATSSSEADRNG